MSRGSEMAEQQQAVITATHGKKRDQILSEPDHCFAIPPRTINEISASLYFTPGIVEISKSHRPIPQQPIYSSCSTRPHPPAYPPHSDHVSPPHPSSSPVAKRPTKVHSLSNSPNSTLTDHEYPKSALHTISEYPRPKGPQRRHSHMKCNLGYLGRLVWRLNILR